MAHELEFVNGKAAMAYVGEKPWHGLGFEVSEDISTDEMMKVAGLDWTVEKHPMFFMDGEEMVFGGRDALVRSTDKAILDTVSPDWKPVQNEEAFKFFHEWVEAGDMSMNTAGSLKGGKMVWALAKVKDGAFDAVKGDTVESYLLFSNPHQYGKSLEVRQTNIRVVCNNTLTMALSRTASAMVRLNHASKFDPEQIKQALGFTHHNKEIYRQKASFLASKKYTPAQLTEYLQQVFPIVGPNERKRELSQAAMTVASVIDTQPGAEFAPGTFWNMFNAVTYTTDHLLGNSNDTRLSSAWFGVNQTKKVNALNLAVEMAEAA